MQVIRFQQLLAAVPDTTVILLAIESSCDETAVAILRGNLNKAEVLSSEISSQIDIHREYGGVVPELASRNHSLALRPLIDAALNKAGVTFEQVDGFAATAGPGLASSLLIGHTAAKAMAVAASKPFISVNHMEGHLLSPFIAGDKGILPNISLVVSGGHTMILHTKQFGEYELLGKSVDDAAGEAYDKVAKMLGLPYPGGPEIERVARDGSPVAYSFPRSMLKRANLDFSFSGLKTAVLYTISELNPETGLATAEQLPDICASFQAAVIEVLVKKTIRAAQSVQADRITMSGGVSCNGALRDAMADACKRHNMELEVCSKHLSTDNAAMIAFVGLQKFLRNEYSDMCCDIDPNLPLNTLKLRK
ncbi:tRNA (adenosine(37)-N6)-threonylcarbamoyltransferase complex transferase subunit TsaD [Rubritalea profundi]|uniref:tRNA (adenosine(37)-N6)-threonylcarbamoyltransferase complex transferase subunit TsaD n=1 Tax=Rubritalea profundi TaxID=1658618 RepID=UPI001F0C03D9|nr:tRNA (adenosine(37)-N6)-threonylcarbamoyltransferase complex transferase subunit TsaD [Rubritalea profundi]